MSEPEIFTSTLNLDESTLRPCGECFACCVYVGITELKKYPGQTCSNLDGADPCKRCTVYESRPSACSSFSCAWRAGLGEDFMRPDLSGLLIAYYTSEINKNLSGIGALSVTITVINPGKAGTIVVGNLRAVLDALIELGFLDIRIISYETKNVIYFLNGEIRAGKLAPVEKGEYEALKFFLYDKLIGTFETGKRD